jgi:hypothetical protein
MKKFNFFPALALIILLISSCEKDQPGLHNEAGGRYSNGVFVVNEGSFGANNGSISFYDPDSMIVINNIFEAVNNRPLGDVVQSMGIAGNKGYIVVNGTGKIEIVHTDSFKTAAEPIIVNYPRYFIPVSNDKGYLTAGSMEGFVYVIDLKSDRIIDTINVGYGPETMVKVGNKVYIANSGGWSVDSTISIINANTDMVIGNIVVGDVPVDMTVDKESNLWVYCKGYAMYNWEPPYNLISETDANIVKINTSADTVELKITAGTAGQYTSTPPHIAASKDGDAIYFLRHNGLYKINITEEAIPPQPVVIGSYYGLDVNPKTGEIYLFESIFTGNGTMFVVDPVTLDVKDYLVGIGPNSAVFNLKD